MQKLVFYILSILLCWYLSGCGKCKDLTYCGYLPVMETYVGMYLPGNWWVYYNQDSSKKDSIYITDFEEQILRDNMELCVEFPIRRFTLHTDYLFYTSLALSGFYSNSSKCCHNYFSLSTSGYLFAMQLDCTDSFPKGNNEIFYDSIEINTAIYKDVIFFDNLSAKLFFAPGMGIVQFINLSDTFALVKFHIQ